MNEEHMQYLARRAAALTVAAAQRQEDGGKGHRWAHIAGRHYALLPAEGSSLPTSIDIDLIDGETFVNFDDDGRWVSLSGDRTAQRDTAVREAAEFLLASGDYNISKSVLAIARAILEEISG